MKLRGWRPLTAAIAAVTAMVALAGCSSGSTSAASTTPSSQQRTIAFVGALTPNVYYDAAQCGFKTEAQAKGVQTILDSPSTFSAQAQVSVLQSVLTRKPNGIVIGPAVDTATIATIANAASQKIPTAIIANPPFNSQAIAYINADVNQATALGVDELAKLLPAGGDVAIIALQPNSAIDALRVNGYKAALTKHPDLKLVQTEYSGVNTANASQLVSSITEAHPSVKGLLVTSGTPTVGAATQVAALGLAGKIKVIGYDASPTAVQAVRSGTVQGVVSQYPQEAGKLALDSILDKLNGKKVQKVQNFKPFLITPQNVDTAAGKKAAYASC
jgi:ribose transport system substrate-binding protein